jgi:hypothetical protein
MSALAIRILLSVAIRLLNDYRNHLTDEQREELVAFWASWQQQIKDMPTPDNILGNDPMKGD